jgi:hypothetical protein
VGIPAGFHLLVLCGSQEAPTPLGPALTDLLSSVEITEVADGQSGFRLVFGGQRVGGGLGTEYAALADERLEPGRRVILVAATETPPAAIIDGLVTDVWLDPGRIPESARVVVSGADLSVAMDLEERITSYPEMEEAMIAAEVIARYARFAMVPKIVQPAAMELPTVVQRTPIQHGTDLDHLYAMADRFGYVFTVRPGPVAGTNVAYWGPPVRVGVPLPALSVGMGALGNVNGLSFAVEGRRAATVSGLIPDPAEPPPLPVDIQVPTLPRLARTTPYPGGPLQGVRLLRDAEGFSLERATAQAQGRVNRAAAQVTQAQGELDVVRYGTVLRAGSLVGVRGGGASFDGVWAIDKVVHKLRRNEYRQSFSLSRDGTGATAPVVRP